jgi:hypothetical protein
MESDKKVGSEYKHYVAISIANNDSVQAVCNPIKCGWYGTVTSDRSVAEAERDEHLKSVSA